MSKRKDLDMPSMDKLEPETIEALREVYKKHKSIRNCKDVYDFGKYRFTLVKEFDRQIKELKGKKK